LVLERAARDMGWIGAPSMIEHLAWLRLPGVFLQMVFGVTTWMVLRRLIDPMVALVAGFLWSTSPYLIAHGRVLHLDALLTGLLTLSLLLLLVSRRQQQAGAGGWTALFGSGALTGLALLTKGPAIIFFAVCRSGAVRPCACRRLIGLACFWQGVGGVSSPEVCGRAL
jgi:4-amino-4-deoxy-L-arabinose transferase-like glycosyltransferase